MEWQAAFPFFMAMFFFSVHRNRIRVFVFPRGVKIIKLLKMIAHAFETANAFRLFLFLLFLLLTFWGVHQNRIRVFVYRLYFF